MSQSTIGQRISEGMKAAKARRAAMPRDLARELKVEQQARQRLAGIGIGLLEQVDALEKQLMTKDEYILRLESTIAEMLVRLNSIRQILGVVPDQDLITTIDELRARITGMGKSAREGEIE